jgi:hypothetical protein|tara:strand:+ start:82 stop:627 length:546 start_codon:yes stop_codon:yes gene_type:complete
MYNSNEFLQTSFDLDPQNLSFVQLEEGASAIFMVFNDLIDGWIGWKGGDQGCYSQRTWRWGEVPKSAKAGPVLLCEVFNKSHYYETGEYLFQILVMTADTVFRYPHSHQPSLSEENSVVLRIQKRNGKDIITMKKSQVLPEGVQKAYDKWEYDQKRVYELLKLLFTPDSSGHSDFDNTISE